MLFRRSHPQLWVPGLFVVFTALAVQSVHGMGARQPEEYEMGVGTVDHAVDSEPRSATQSATFFVACIKQCRISLNSKVLSETPPEKWREGARVPVFVKVGDVIGVEAYSHGPWGAIVGELSCSGVLTPTSSAWKVAHREIDFERDRLWGSKSWDDSKWRHASELMPYGDAKDDEFGVVQIPLPPLPQAHWIWSGSRDDSHTVFRYKVTERDCRKGPGGFTGPPGSAPLSETLGGEPRPGFNASAYQGQLGHQWTVEHAEAFWNRTVNLAVNKKTTQSSTQGNRGPQLAVDGDTDGDYDRSGSVSATGVEESPWWQIDLGYSTYLHDVVVFPRTDASKDTDKLRSFYLMTSMYPIPETPGITIRELLDMASIRATVDRVTVVHTNVTIPVQSEARFVRIQMENKGSLQLAEVELWGNKCDKKCDHGGKIDWAFCTCNCTLPWGGEDCSVCAKPCKNGAKQNPLNCECTDCPYPWDGRYCDQCTLSKCEHDGVLDYEDCECQCKDGWGGGRCQVCTRTCEHGGILDTQTCTCGCPTEWKGDETCSQATIVAGDCANESGFVENMGACNCKPPWTGPKCTICPIRCLDGGTIDPLTCTCNCPNGNDCTDKSCLIEKCYNGGTLDFDECVCRCPGRWTGETCLNCNVTCENEQPVNSESCTCGCSLPYSGSMCQSCVLDSTMNFDGLCKNKGRAPADSGCGCECLAPWTGGTCEECAGYCGETGILNPTACTCECGGLWEGQQCDSCRANNDDCGGYGSFNETGCSCNCAPGRTGRRCEECARKCQNDGDLNEKTCTCTCKEPWKGFSCDECSIECKHGGILDHANCRCTHCDGLWSGRDCGECLLKCENGGVKNPDTCTCDCAVGSGWSGVECTQCNRWCAKNAPVTSNCECACPGNWGGNSCLQCELECFNNGILNNNECECHCPAGFTGKQCENKVCLEIDCGSSPVVRGVFDKNSCECNCTGAWEGPACGDCNFNKLIEVDCMNGGERNETLCGCHCPKPWQGSTCEDCPIDHCRNGGTLDKANCRCNCLTGFSGTHCEGCELNCIEGRGIADPNICACHCLENWAGERCEACGLNATSCVGGSQLHEETCQCVCPEGLTGPECGQCAHMECKNGGVLPIDQKECQCICPLQFTGADCSEVMNSTYTPTVTKFSNETTFPKKHVLDWLKNRPKKKAKVPKNNFYCGKVLYVCEQAFDDDDSFETKMPQLVFKFGTKVSTDEGVPYKEQKIAPGLATFGGIANKVEANKNFKSLGFEAASLYGVATGEGNYVNVVKTGNAKDAKGVQPAQTRRIVQSGRRTLHATTVGLLQTDSQYDYTDVADTKAYTDEIMEPVEMGSGTKKAHSCKPLQEAPACAHGAKTVKGAHAELKELTLSAKCFKVCHPSCMNKSKSKGECFYECMHACTKPNDKGGVANTGKLENLRKAP